MKKIPEILHYLISEIQEEKFIDAIRVSEFLKRTDIKEKELFEFVNFNHSAKESYGRNVIFDGGFFKLMLMSWNNNDFTAIHDHGGVEWGAVRSFGNVSNAEFEYKNKGLKFIKEEILKKGEVTTVTPELIHQTGNKSGRNTLTMHLYGSNSKSEDIMNNARIFDSVEKRIYYTSGAAYLKLPSEIILKKEDKLNVDITSFEYDKLVRLNYQNIKLINKI